MRLFLALTLLLGTATLTAQLQIPKFNSTFSSGTATRGFYFQAPAMFLITGVRVPDETNHGKQNVEIREMTAKPPAFSATTTGKVLFYKTGVPSTQVIPCIPPIIVQKDTWIGVLGACGDASGLKNSYGPSGAFTSTIMGQNVTLRRFLTQFNIVSAGQGKPVSSEDNYNPSRIFVYIAGMARGDNYGTGTGNPAPWLVTSAAPTLGWTGEVRLKPFNTGNTGGLILMGRGQAQIPLPIGTFLLNPSLLFTFNLGGPIPPAGGTVRLPVPKDPVLTGAALYFQGLITVGTSIYMTNGERWTLGQ